MGRNGGPERVYKPVNIRRSPELAEQFGSALAIRGLSERQLAREVGIGRSTVHRVLTCNPDSGNVAKRTFAKLVNHLGLELQERRTLYQLAGLSTVELSAVEVDPNLGPFGQRLIMVAANLRLNPTNQHLWEEYLFNQAEAMGRMLQYMQGVQEAAEQVTLQNRGSRRLQKITDSESGIP